MCDLNKALRVAYRHIDDPTTREPEREAILAAMAVYLPCAEADLAARQLYHLREQRRLQLTLRGLLDAQGGQG